MYHRYALRQSEGGIHQRKVAECLREVTKLSLVFRVVLLGEQANVVAGRGGSVKQPARILSPAHHLIDRSEPERAGQKDAFFAGETIYRRFRLESKQQPVLEKFTLNCLDCSHNARIG